MFYSLLLPYINISHIANLFHYITFRCAIGFLFALFSSIYFGRSIIKNLKYWQKFGQPIREVGPETHKSKQGTPTMGGIIILAFGILSCLLFNNLRNPYVWIILIVLIGFGILGFIDDYLKVIKRNSNGISAKGKMLAQILLSALSCFLVQKFASPEYASKLALPFFKDLLIDMGAFYIPFGCFVIIGASNAVNLTDGLDGLAVVPVILSLGCLGIISYLVGNQFYAEYLQIIYVPITSEIAVTCSCIMGSCLGFLWYNSKPAEVFMGDTGSLSLGGTLGIISVITKHEITLAIIGGLFVIETLSVIIQVLYFKYTGGKRIFLMSPIHHHFEKLGWPETKVVVRFWIISCVFALLGLCSLKLR